MPNGKKIISDTAVISEKFFKMKNLLNPSRIGDAAMAFIFTPSLRGVDEVTLEINKKEGPLEVPRNEFVDVYLWGMIPGLKKIEDSEKSILKLIIQNIPTAEKLNEYSHIIFTKAYSPDYEFLGKDDVIEGELVISYRLTPKQRKIINF